MCSTKTIGRTPTHLGNGGGTTNTHNQDTNVGWERWDAGYAVLSIVDKDAPVRLDVHGCTGLFHHLIVGRCAGTTCGA